MKILLPGFAILLGVLLALFSSATEDRDAAASTPIAPLAAPRERDLFVASTADTAAGPAPQATAPQPSAAQRILERTRFEVDRLEQFSARVRVRVALFDQDLIGAGTYFQTGVGQQKKLRSELRLQTGETVVSAFQVCDGRYAWSNTETFIGPMLTRVDLRRLRQRREQAGAELPEELWAWGGLPKLLKQLETNFQWDQAQTGYLEADKTPAWSIRGMWRGAEYAKLVPQQAGQVAGGVLEGFPPQIPGSVTLYIRQTDYFPQRIEYRRPPLGAKGNVPPEDWVPCVMIEFTDIATDRPIEPATFEFQPSKQQEVVDLTENLLLMQQLP
jgi:hypothetical protein